jgi:hypothetical protein
LGFFAGALAYYVGDRLVDQAGGAARQDLDGTPPSGSGAAMFLGALLDGVPEAFILGVGLASATRSASRSSPRSSSPTSRRGSRGRRP